MIVGLSRAVNRMSQATAAVRAGDFGVRIPVQRRDQVGDLQRSFNEMAGTWRRWSSRGRPEGAAGEGAARSPASSRRACSRATCRRAAASSSPPCSSRARPSAATTSTCCACRRRDRGGHRRRLGPRPVERPADGHAQGRAADPDRGDPGARGDPAPARCRGAPTARAASSSPPPSAMSIWARDPAASPTPAIRPPT